MKGFIVLVLLYMVQGCVVVDKVGANALDGTVATLTGIVTDEDGVKVCRYQNGVVTLYRPRVGRCALEIAVPLGN